MSDLLKFASSHAKDFTTLVAAMSAIAYAIGYLALRTRGFVLGIEPGAELVNAAYVFAGFRFLLVTGFFLLLLAVPAIACAQLFPLSVPHGALAWVTVSALACATVALFALLARLQGVLLGNGSKTSVLWQGGLAFALSLLATALTGVTFMWLAMTADELRAGEALPILVGLIAALQGFLLPMLHGAFYADRTVRELATMPDGLQGLREPVWLVERSKDRVALFARDAAAAPRLLSLPSARIDGIPVARLARLSEMVGANRTVPDAITRSAARATLAVALVIIGGIQAMAQTPPPQTNEGFFRLAWSSLKAIPELLGSLGESGVDAGEIWEYRLADGHRQRMSRNADLAWPVRRPDGTIVALQDRSVVQLDAEGAISGRVGPMADWKKLLGVSPNGEIFGIIGYDTAQPAVLTSTGVLASLPEPVVPAERGQLQMLLMESRRYQTAVIRVGASERGGGTDIYLEKAGVVRNISNCGARRCGQAVLTPDGSVVLYVVARR